MWSHSNRSKMLIDDLPDEVLVLILRRFDLLERLRLRAVCWRWKLIIESFPIKDVCIVDSYFNKKSSWDFFGLESLNCQNLIYSEPSSLYRRITSLFGNLSEPHGSLQLVSKHRMFAGLKSMFISFESINSFRFEKYINPHFTQLEQLSCFNLNLVNKETRLSLPRLKVLSLALWSRPSDMRIRLEVPSMYKLLTTTPLDRFEFTYPKTVTHLFSLVDHESIVRLSNLAFLCCTRLDHESTTFANLTKLKEINFLKLSVFNANSQDFSFDPNVIQEPISEERLAEIYEAKQRLGRYELRMSVKEVDYRTHREIVRDEPGKKLTEGELYECYLKGRIGSSPLFPVIQQVSYDAVLDGFDYWAMPSSLFDVRAILASRRTRDDVGSFFRLLADHRSIFVLHLKAPFDGMSEEQDCYNSLPSRCRFLRKLTMYNTRGRTTPIDLSFVLGFDYLQSLKLNQMVQADFIESLFGKLKYFQVLELRGRRQMKIIKSEHQLVSKYTLSVKQWQENEEPNKEEKLTFYSLKNLLITYLKKIKADEFAD